MCFMFMTTGIRAKPESRDCGVDWSEVDMRMGAITGALRELARRDYDDAAVQDAGTGVG